MGQSPFSLVLERLLQFQACPDLSERRLFFLGS